MKVFNNVKRWLLVLVCSVGSVGASEFEKNSKKDIGVSYGTGYPVAVAVEGSTYFDLCEDNQNTEVLKMIDSHPDAKYLILFGNAGAGKTTLANLLTHKEVKPEMEDGEYRLAGEGISHGRNGSEQINCYFDQANNRMVLDFQGFADPRSEANVRNTLSRKEVLDRLSEYKICFVTKKTDVMGRTTHFEEMLNRGYSFFPDQILDESSYLVIMDGTTFDRHAKLSKILSAITGEEYKSNNLLHFFSQNSCERTSHFVAPDNLVSYQDVGEVDVVWENLESVTAKKLRYVPVLDAKDKELISRQIESDTIRVTNFLRNTVEPSIINTAYAKISSAQYEQRQEGALTAQQLKNEFKEAKATLKEAIQSGVESLQKCLIEGGLDEDVIQDPNFNVLCSADSTVKRNSSHKSQEI